ncbi:cytochrome P450 [Parerythrobacter jejuensis]|uniref:Cytochrome P450 n=1 Tax=Parerythrobacter jejuensis TaxID=795812 RepID=A0A845AV77_9SPHN|nr:cytochrome P450 [Parerythrobacter jejuensis]MXP30235.1 cytochrome P450 [Parerythrobacter jejuensis]MXP32995.1 cytochrome P450 [Parerythrobacter jejuensis]
MANTVTEAEQPDINLFDPQVQQCPYDAYKTLRDEAPVFRIEGTDMFVVSRYDDVRRILMDPVTFPSSSADTPFRASAGNIERGQMVAERFAEKGWVPAPTLNGRDDPEHKQMRAMFNQAFKPSKIKEIDPKVETLAYELIDSFLDDGHCNWVQQFCIPLPLFIIGEQMGAKREDMWQIKRWTDAFFHRISLMLPEDQHMEMVDREIEAQQYFQPIFERLRKEPDDSLISVLVNTVIEEWGRPLTDNELHAEMMADTFVGGSETTTNALAAGMKLLIENKDVWHQLRNDPDTYMKTFVEEVVRLESPVQSLMRFVASDIEIDGVAIPAGSMINVRFAAANRDERQFECPEKLDLDRPKAGSHMGFGSGVHHCLGAPLARRELAWGFTAVIDRFEDMWFAEGKNDFTYHPHFLLRSLKELHIEFEPKKR